jgi:NTP pyrophosphatase (non-canonical NTP hydrolase)
MMIPANVFIVFMLLCIVLLYALTPDARITRAVKALFDKRRWASWMHPEQNLNFLIHDIGTWTKGAFADSGGHGAAMHLKKEADELLEAVDAYIEYKANVKPGERPVDLNHFLDELGYEMADIGILLFDIAFMQEVDLTDYLLRKHKINTGRKWSPPDEHGVQHHIEEPKGTCICGKPIHKNENHHPQVKFEQVDPGPDQGGGFKFDEKTRMWREDGSLIKGEDIKHLPISTMVEPPKSTIFERALRRTANESPKIEIKPFDYLDSLTTDQSDAVQAVPDPVVERVVGKFVAEQADESDLL